MGGSVIGIETVNCQHGTAKSAEDKVEHGIVGPSRPQAAVLADVSHLDPELDISAVGIRAGINHAIVGVEQPGWPVPNRERTRRRRALAGGRAAAGISAPRWGVKVGILGT